MGQVLLAGEEPHEWPALLAYMVTDGPAKHGIQLLQRVEDRALCRRALGFELHFAADLCECSQMCRQNHGDHGIVCTSTESTPGRSLTMGCQLSPASADACTSPPRVPKNIPHLSI